MAITCSYIENAGPINHADEQRRVHEALLSGRYGAVNANDLAVTANGTPNTTVNVGVGRAFVPGSSANWQGVYHVTSDAVVNVDCGVADATNPRNDLIVLHVYDNLYDASGKNFAIFEVLKGTPSGSPVDPTVPANCHVLARCYRPAATNPIGTGPATITSLRTFIFNTGQLGAATLQAAGASGLAAATPARLIGGTSNVGAPTVGTWQTSDIVVDFNATVWICYSGGTPGSWRPAGPVKIDEQNPSSGAGVIINVPSWARKITIDWSVRSALAANSDTLQVQFNGDVSAAYNYVRTALIGAYGSTGTQNAQTAGVLALVPAASSFGGVFDSGTFELYTPNATGRRRGWFNRTMRNDGGIAASGPEVSAGDWNNTANAITTINLGLATGTYVAGCSFVATAHP